MERRQFARQRVLRHGKILVKGLSVLDCVVSDQSEGGMRVEFTSPTKLPAEFRLVLPSSDWSRPCTRRWQRGLAAGVQFAGPAQKAPARKW
jgi:hypothetical protein